MEFLKNEIKLAISLCFLLVVLCAVVQDFSFKYMKSKCQEVLVPLVSADTSKAEIISLKKKTEIDYTILDKQYNIAQKISEYYKNLSTSYYANYYSFVNVSIFFTVLLSLSIFLIGSKGWENSSVIVKTLFLTTLSIASVFHFLSSVLNTKENFHNNTEKVKLFEEIQYEILYASSNRNFTQIQIDSCVTSNFKKISSNIDFIATLNDSDLNNELTKLQNSVKK